MNDLLLWMSVRQSGSLQAFRARTAETLPPTAGRAARYREAAWALSKLGHAEFGIAAADTGWRVAPPVLAAGELDGPCRAVLCGARTPELVTRITQVAAQFGGGARITAANPDLIEVETPNASTLAALAREVAIHLQWNAPLAILASCTQPKAAILDEQPMPVGAGWSVSRFSKSQLAWVPSTPAEARLATAGLFRFRADYGTSYVLVEEGRGWACEPSLGKFRILTRRHRALAYDAARKEFAVSTACRPPELVERALVVCSGRLPTFRTNVIIYPLVEPAVAEAAAEFLGQRLYQRSLL